MDRVIEAAEAAAAHRSTKCFPSGSAKSGERLLCEEQGTALQRPGGTCCDEGLSRVGRPSGSEDGLRRAGALALGHGVAVRGGEDAAGQVALTDGGQVDHTPRAVGVVLVELVGRRRRGSEQQQLRREAADGLGAAAGAQEQDAPAEPQAAHRHHLRRREHGARCA